MTPTWTLLLNIFWSFVCGFYSWQSLVLPLGSCFNSSLKLSYMKQMPEGNVGERLIGLTQTRRCTGEWQIFVFCDKCVLNLPGQTFRLEESLDICALSQMHRHPDDWHHECHESTPGTGRCLEPRAEQQSLLGGGIAVVTGCREWEHQTFISSMVSEKNTVQLLKCAALKKRIWIGLCISTSSGTPAFPLPSISHLHNWKLQS